MKVRKIAFEEHFMSPGLGEYSKSFTQQIDPAVYAKLASRLADFDALRLAEMDAASIDYAILSQTGPGIQGETDPIRAARLASQSNDFLAEQVARRPERYGGFAALAMQDAQVAAKEVQRTVEELGFKGALVNGQTGGTYYDDPSYDVLWERLQDLDVPLYLHPADAYIQPHAFFGHPELNGATWGWGVDTATHALRLLFGGVFDRFPNLKIILGHMGEGLPYQRWRFDSRFAVYSYGLKLARAPSEYIGSNILVTTSGVCSHPALLGAIGEVGPDAVMFSVDYPYESSTVAADFIDNAPLESSVKQQICYGNAQRLFKLKEPDNQH